MSARAHSKAAPAGRVSGPGARTPYRMKDLCELTGLSRQAIHFYVQQGLVPPGKKTGRNMAYYGEEHLERLLLIRKLQHERFLPLKAIKAVLDGKAGRFAPAQRQILREIKDRLSEPSLHGPERVRTLDAQAVCKQHGVQLAELERMAEIGLVALVEDGGKPRIAEDDAWVVEHWGRIRALGFTEEVGFSVDHLRMYEEAVTTLFEREKELMLARLSRLSAERAAIMLEQVLPVIHSFVARYHAAQVRNFFAAME